MTVGEALGIAQAVGLLVLAVRYQQLARRVHTIETEGVKLEVTATLEGPIGSRHPAGIWPKPPKDEPS